MSLERSITLNCPKCDHSQNMVVWTSLNAQVSPEAKVDFFNGKINVFECEKCGNKASLATHFMYHDMQLHFCVQYYPPDSIDDDETLKYYKPDGTSSVDLFGPMQSGKMADAEYMLRPHIVFSMQEALLYVVFREKLAAYHQSRQVK